jgi:E3 ubiquitin-protein ligase HECTD2
VSEIDAWDTMQNHQLQNEDSSSSDGDLHPRSQSQNQSQGHPSQRPRHTRSVSHPFPSLFFSSGSSSSRTKKKKQRSSPHRSMAAGRPDESGSESGLDGDVYAPVIRANPNPNPPLPPPPPVRGHRNASSMGGSRDFTAGRCMTCGSLVRWPRELCMFRCTICLTVNDLQPPPGRDARREDVALEEQQQPGPRGMIEVAHSALGSVGRWLTLLRCRQDDFTRLHQDFGRTVSACFSNFHLEETDWWLCR